MTALVLVVSGVRAYQVTRDPLHPMVYFVPMLLYQYVLLPALLLGNNAVEPYFPDLSMLDLVLTVNLLAIGLLCVGCLRGAVYIPHGRRPLMNLAALSPQARRKVFQLACFLGIVALACYGYLVLGGGGFWEIYGRAKGYLYTPSGYISDTMYLAYPAIILLAIAWQGRRLQWRHWALMLLFASPHLIHGLLGARRGPTFLVLATLGLSWYLVKARRPSLRGLLVGLGMVALTVMFLDPTSLAKERVRPTRPALAAA